jgi:hypothetical protein
VLRRIGTWGWLMLAVSLLGLLLRVEHALTFDQAQRASDYQVHLDGVRFVQRHWEAFYHTAGLSLQVRSDPPLWYFLSALLLTLRDDPRLLALLSVLAWVLRHGLLWRLLHEALPRQPLSRLAALSIHAVLPLSVLIDGKANAEGLFAGMFFAALYALWRIERRCQQSGRVSVLAGAAFGAFAALALLAKLTGGMLVVVGVAVFAWAALGRAQWVGIRAASRALIRPALAAGVMWCAVAGWWSSTNVARFNHPFPHAWQLTPPLGAATAANPPLYARPLGWALPLEWRGYWDLPILRSPSEPRPNFWATQIAGTWSDIYNRGFCRLKGGPSNDRVWGAKHGFLSMPTGVDAWSVSQRCIDWFAGMLHVGVWLTFASLIALLWCLWQALWSRGTRGSLALTLTPFMCTASAFWLGLAYPLDNTAVTNPRYLLAQVTPMCACLGIGLAQLEGLASRKGRPARLAKSLLWAVLGCIAAIACMLVFIRFGR